MEKPGNSERGQALLLVVFSMALLLGFVGFAVDVGMLFRTRQILQTAADGAAIAGAAEINYSDYNAAAQAAATQNGITNGSNGATVTVNYPPSSGPNKGKAGYVEVIVTRTQPSGFYRLVHGGVITVSARSVASNGPSHNCLYTLGTSGTDINVTGLFASLNVPNCGIVDNSSSGSALSLNGFLDSISAGSIAVTGGTSGVGLFNSVTPTAVTGTAPSADPLSYLATYDPAIPGSCASAATINVRTSLNPGCWKGLTLSGGDITFNPGLYIINGNLSIPGTIGSVSGSGVTFYVTGAINFSGAQLVNLSAPTSGLYNGILFFAPLANTNTMSLTFGASYSVLSGIVYLPGANLSFTGLTSTTFNSSIIVSTFSFTGIGQVNDYALVNPLTPLTGTRVVE